MPATQRTRVAVIGAGPAGAATATVLARAGHEVQVFDRATFPRDKVCGDALSNQAVALLHELGAADSVLSGAHATVNVARAVLPDGTPISRTYDPPGIIVPRLLLDDALCQAMQRAGAHLHSASEVRSLQRSKLGYELQFAADASPWQAELVIAADGNGSIARAQVGHPKPQGRTLAVGITAYLEGVSFDAGSTTSDHYFERELRGGYGWVFPEVKGIANVGVYQRADHFKRGGRKLPEMLDSFLARHPERFADSRQVGRRRTWPLPIGPAPWSRSGHQLLIAGDAGNQIDPLSGEGIWQALCSGMHAGAVAVEALREGVLSPALKRDYAQRCARDIERSHRMRLHLQDAMDQVVSRGLYETRIVRAALRWGYRRGPFEGSKGH